MIKVKRKNDFDMNFDEETSNYYVIWEPVIIGMGKTEPAALNDLRQAAHCCTDTLIDLKIKGCGKRKGE